MRFLSFGIGVAVLLAASAASASGGVGGKGDTGGKGGPGPTNETGAGTGAGATAGPLDTSQQQFGGASTPEKAGGTAPPPQKAWEVAGTFETHRLIRQEDLGGAGAVKTFNVLFAVGRYDITDKDRVSISGGGYQFFLADSGETGFRASDISLGYTRRIPLPAELLLRLSAATTIPISFESQLASNITSPSVSMALSRKFGDLALEARITGGAFIDRYTTAGAIGSSSASSPDGANASGQPNPKWRFGGTLTAEYSMPFHRPLSAGVGLIDSYVWFYDVGQCPVSMPMCGVVQDPQFGNQPTQQSYGGEVFVRYQMPNVGGMKSDITLALANGDPSLGYPSVMNGTGILHPYFFYRDTAEFYAALSATY